MKKILVVDDSAFARATLRQTLKGAGYEVYEASSGLEAIEMMPTLQPDLVTLDLLMPEMRGDELLGYLRRVSEHCPLLIVTADVQTMTRNDMLAAGASGFVTKPFRQEDLLQEIERLLGETSR